ncbi:MAG: hypothetical protein WCW27_02015 [Patescibacteria group bacterium]|jgi:hypothetical protein
MAKVRNPKTLLTAESLDLVELKVVRKGLCLSVPADGYSFSLEKLEIVCQDAIEAARTLKTPANWPPEFSPTSDRINQALELVLPVTFIVEGEKVSAVLVKLAPVWRDGDKVKFESETGKFFLLTDVAFDAETASLCGGELTKIEASVELAPGGEPIVVKIDPDTIAPPDRTGEFRVLWGSVFEINVVSSDSKVLELWLASGHYGGGFEELIMIAKGASPVPLDSTGTNVAYLVNNKGVVRRFSPLFNMPMLVKLVGVMPPTLLERARDFLDRENFNAICESSGHDFFVTRVEIKNVLRSYEEV